jgi:hypothetical protein
VLTRAVVLGLVATALAGCAGESSSQSATETKAAATPAKPATSAKALSRPAAKEVCPVTLPNGSAPPGEKPARTHHGNGKIWTGLWPYGVIIAGPDYVRPDGSVRMKFFWFADVDGDITIRGRRLDGTAAPVRAEANLGWPESGFTGKSFWASELIFPTEGCWRITATVGNARLTFVNLVVKPR